MTALQNDVPPPVGVPIARKRRPEFSEKNPDPLEGLITDEWAAHWANQENVIERFPGRVAEVNLADQAASIGVTDINTGPLSGGRYRISYFAAVTTQGGISETVDITFAWTYRGAAYSLAIATLNSISLGAHREGSFLISIDGLSPVTYQVVVANHTTGLYDLAIVLEEVKA